MIKEQTEMYHKFRGLCKRGGLLQNRFILKMVIMIATWKSRRINLKHL